MTGFRLNSRWVALLWALLLFVLYGSFYPFNFSDSTPSNWWIWGRWSAGDMAANVLMFIPYGVLCALHHRDTDSRSTTVWLIIGLVVAIFAQWGQFYLPSRDPAWGDIFWNAAGAAIGFILVRYVQPFLQVKNVDSHERLGLAIGALVLLCLWFPLMPTLQMNLLIQNLKALLWTPSLPEIARYTVLWLGLFAVAMTRTTDRQRLFIGTGVLLMSLFIQDNPFSLSKLAGFSAALLLTRYYQQHRFLLLTALIVLLFVSSWLPWHIGHELNTIHWVPFQTLLQGEAYQHVSPLLNIFLHSMLIIVFVWQRSRSLGAGLVSALLLQFLAESGQILMLGRTPDITPLFLAGMAGLLLYRWRNRHLQWLPFNDDIKTTVWDTLLNVEWLQISRLKTGHYDFWRQHGFIVLLISALVLSVSLWIVLRLPQFPYNVREFFLPWPFSKWVFMLALLSVGYSCSRIAVLTGPIPSGILKFWWRNILACGLFYFLLCFSITDESLANIAGFSRMRFFLANQLWWGEFGRQFVIWTPALVFDGVERAIRFIALFLPIFLSLSAALYVARQQQLRSVFLFFFCTPLYWLCQWIAFTYSSTDNARVLIRNDVFFGFGGGAYLYVLLFLMAATTAYLSFVKIKRENTLLAVMVLLLTSQIAYGLVQLALVDDFFKYGATPYSSIDFLLSSERQQKLPDFSLYFCFSAAYVVSVFLLAFSMRVGLPIQKKDDGQGARSAPRFAPMPGVDM